MLKQGHSWSQQVCLSFAFTYLRIYSGFSSAQQLLFAIVYQASAETGTVEFKVRLAKQR